MSTSPTPAALITGLFETHLNVANLERSIEFYEQVLGLQLGIKQEARRMAIFWIGGSPPPEIAPNPGEAIEDKYGWVAYGAGGVGSALVGTSQFPSLGVSGWELLAIIDPEEFQRVRDAASPRAARRRRRNKTPPDWPDWLIHDTSALSESEEKAALERAGLTLEGAKKLVGLKGQ